mmetsp:Transcript_118/g.151  ORF Transcript_118/g.151 Transcript_118/m.151 type:complete len:112 (+) Transcript_118:198-533(+)
MWKLGALGLKDYVQLHWQRSKSLVLVFQFSTRLEDIPNNRERNILSHKYKASELQKKHGLSSFVLPLEQQVATLKLDLLLILLMASFLPSLTGCNSERLWTLSMNLQQVKE